MLNRLAAYMLMPIVLPYLAWTIWWHDTADGWLFGDDPDE